MRLREGTEVPRNYVEIEVPCGKCIQCKISKSREWTCRCLHELQTTKGPSFFVTLTYDDDHLPENGFLIKSDLQLFYKRLRKYTSFRYFSSGEYGSVGLRPHYHCILFGARLDLHKTVNGYVAPLIEEVWKFGRHHVGTVTQDSLRYVADYTLKALNLESDFTNPVPKSFLLVSKGLGRAWCDNNSANLASGTMRFNGTDIGVPRYYARRMNLDMATLTEEKRLNHMKDLASQAGVPIDDEFAIFHQEEVNGLQRGRNSYARESFKGDLKL